MLDAETALQKVQEGASPEDVEKAQLAVNKAQRDQVRSTIAVQDAQQKVNDIISVGVVQGGQQVGTLNDQEIAQLDLADALDNVQTAAFNTTDAQKNLTDTLNKGKPGSDDYKAATDNLTTAQKNLTTALEDQVTAHDNVIQKQQDQAQADDDLRKAQAGDPDFDAKLADAVQKVADAHENTATQIEAEAQANEDLNTAEGALVTARLARAAQQPAVGPNVQGPFLDRNSATVPAGVQGPAANRNTVNSTFGAGLTVPINLTIDGRAVAQATVTYTADELAKLAKVRGLS